MLKDRFIQGNTYNLEIALSADSRLIKGSDVSEIEFMFGSIRKLYPEEVSFVEEKGLFVVPLSQEETFALKKGETPCQARVKFATGAVKASEARSYRVGEALSKAVL